MARPPVLTALLLLAAAPAAAQDGGIEVFAAETLFAQGTRVSLTHIWDRRGTLVSSTDEVSDPLDRVRTEQRAVLGLDRGLRPGLSASVLVPFAYQGLDTNAGDLSSAGLGDVALLAKYRVLQRNAPGRTFNVAVVGGAELPTGRTDARDGGALLPPGLQSGSGSWDPFVSVTTNYGFGDWRLDAFAFHKVNTQGEQSWDRGDFTAVEVDGAWRFLHRKYPGATASAAVGVQWRHEGAARQSGTTVPNTGGQEVRVRPKLVWHPGPAWDVALQAEVPVYRDVTGTQLGLDVRTFVAVGFRF